MLLKSVQFASILAYYPHDDTTKGRSYKNRVLDIKFDKLWNPKGNQVPILQSLAEILAADERTKEIRAFLGNSVTLIPAPVSKAINVTQLKDSLWVPKRFCEEIIKTGLYTNLSLAIERKSSVKKSAYAKPGERPTITEHFNSLSITDQLITTESIMVVDDVITKGSTLLACVSKLQEAYPEKRIIALAAIRTLRQPIPENESMLQPFIGTIQLQEDSAYWTS